MSFAIKPTNCKRCGKSLSMFEGRYCLECQKEIDKELEIYEGNTGVFDEPYPWRPDEIIGILKHIIEVADTNSCGVKEIDGIDEEAINNAITIIGSFEQIKWERDTAIAQLKELGYEFGEKIRTDDDLISRQAVKEQMIEYGFHAPDMTITEFVEDLPPINPQEPKTGHWSRKTKVDAYDIAGVKTWGIKCQCDRCDFTTIVVEDFGYYKYCPNCGARMAESEG